VQVEHDCGDGGEEEVHGRRDRVGRMEYRVWSGLNEKRAGLMTAWRTEWRTEWIEYPGYDVHRVGRGHVAPSIDERTMNRASALRYRAGLSGPLNRG
jgi:hypothetical protein